MPSPNPHCFSTFKASTSLSRSYTYLPRRTYISTPLRLAQSPRPDHSKQAVSSNYKAPPVPKPRGQSSPLRVWPFILIFATGTYLYVQIVNQRKGSAPPSNESWRTLTGGSKDQIR